MIEEWVRRKGLVSGIVDLFEHYPFLQIPFPLSPLPTAPKAAEDLPIMRSQDSGMLHSLPVAFASHRLG